MQFNSIGRLECGWIFGITIAVLLLQLGGCTEPDAVISSPEAQPAEESVGSDVDPQANAEPTPQEDGPLWEILAMSESGENEAAIKRFVESDTDWVATTTIPVLQLSESEFGQLNRRTRNKLQVELIGYVTKIRGFTRSVIAHANELNQQGESDAAAKHVDAVKTLGTQLRDADIVSLLQKTGLALTQASLDE